MRYELSATEQFNDWFDRLKDGDGKRRILARFERVQNGHFGDIQSLKYGLFEMRFFFGPGYRVYYTVSAGYTVVLLIGGNKSTQKKDIKMAYAVMRELGR